jgi:hypothetical protein
VPTSSAIVIAITNDLEAFVFPWQPPCSQSRIANFGSSAVRLRCRSRSRGPGGRLSRWPFGLTTANAKDAGIYFEESRLYPAHFSNGLDDAIRMVGFLQGQTAWHRTSLDRREACRVDHRPGSCARQRLAICQPLIRPGSLMSVTSTSATRRLHHTSACSPLARMDYLVTFLAQRFYDQFADKRVVLDDEYVVSPLVTITQAPASTKQAARPPCDLRCFSAPLAITSDSDTRDST